MKTNGAHIEAKLLSYIRENCLPSNSTADLAYDQNLFDAGIVDSAGLISFLNYIEKEFSLTIPDEDLLPENFVSINSMAAYIRSHQRVPV
jgi:acyl carrier protein